MDRETYTLNEQLSRTEAAKTIAPGDVLETSTVASATVTDTMTLTSEATAYGIELPETVTVTAVETYGFTTEIYLDVDANGRDYRTRIELPSTYSVRTA